MRFWDSVQAFEKDFLIKALERNDWNISKTCHEIGLSVRSMRNKMIQYDLRTLRDLHQRKTNSPLYTWNESSSGPFT